MKVAKLSTGDFSHKEEKGTKEPKKIHPVKIPGSPHNSLLKKLMTEPVLNTPQEIQKKIIEHAQYDLSRDIYNFGPDSAYHSTAMTVRDKLIKQLNTTNHKLEEKNPKRTFYLSIEYLLGRSLRNSLLNMEIEPKFKSALNDFGYHLEDLYEEEVDAGLGNGGLGRLAACYLDSMATQNLPCWGYGLRYTYGMFKQYVSDGWQMEAPDIWLKNGNPWETVRSDIRYVVNFYGKAITFRDSQGLLRFGWEPAEEVIAVAHDVPIPGFNTEHTVNLRLWNSEPSDEFDLAHFNDANYYKAIEKRQHAENISSVLYPNDNKEEGKALRLKQQYFFASATIQDILHNFKKHNSDLTHLPDKVCIQLNDTHPTISIAELMRILVDVELMPWDTALDVVSNTFAYTNHTVMPEALEKWSIHLFNSLLPRHLHIIGEINRRFVEQISQLFPENSDIVRKLSIVDFGEGVVRMANLAVVLCFKVNGVAAIHSDIIKNEIFREFHQLFPDKFVNVTNGITPRRWLANCNPELTQLIKSTLGSDRFLTDLEGLSAISKLASDPSFQAQWQNIKLIAKQRLADYILKETGTQVDPNALFDIQVKRIHEYKRQLLNILRVIHLYKNLREKISRGESTSQLVPKVVVFGGKAAPGYYQAKLIIKLINSVAEVVNADESIGNLLKVFFLPNYNVSMAELIVPASDLSEHISTAGMEASGTSNMKFALNGGLIIGTLDGANIEIRDAIGHDNMFVFGLTADQVPVARHQNHKRVSTLEPLLAEVIEEIREGRFGPPEIFTNIIYALAPENDYFLVGADFKSYLAAHDEVDRVFRNKSEWTKRSILSTAGMGRFSSDRSVLEYGENIWHIQAMKYKQ